MQNKLYICYYCFSPNTLQIKLQMKNKLHLTTLLLLFINGLSGQSFIQAYADIANQVSQSNVTNNLTEFEALGVKRRGTQPLEDTYVWLRNKYLGFGYTNAQLQEDTFTNGSFTCKNLIVTKVGTLYPDTFVIIWSKKELTLIDPLFLLFNIRIFHI